MTDVAIHTPTRIIHIGNGKVAYVEDQVMPDRTEAIPPKPQKLWLKRPNRELSIAVPSIRAHTDYKPGPITDMGADQCRYFLIDENHTVCGAKTEVGKSWCPAHCKIVHGSGK